MLSDTWEDYNFLIVKPNQQKRVLNLKDTYTWGNYNFLTVKLNQQKEFFIWKDTFIVNTSEIIVH